MVLMFKILNVPYCEIHVIKHIVTKKYSKANYQNKNKNLIYLIFTTDVRENNVTESFLEHFCYNFQHWFTISLLFCFKFGKIYINQPTLTATCCPSWVSALWTWARLAAAIGSSSNFLKNSWGCFPKSSWNSCSIWNYIRHSTWSNYFFFQNMLMSDYQYYVSSH